MRAQHSHMRRAIAKLCGMDYVYDRDVLCAGKFRDRGSDFEAQLFKSNFDGTVYELLLDKLRKLVIIHD